MVDHARSPPSWALYEPQFIASFPLSTFLLNMSNDADSVNDPPDATGPDLPSIQVTNDFSTPHLAGAGTADEQRSNPPESPFHQSHSTQHTRSPSDPLYLTPAPFSPHPHGGRSSLDVPSTPSLSLNTGDGHSSDGSTMPPPSPTSSTRSSFQAVSSLALRDNKPEEKTGLSSLNLLTPGRPHGRKGSVSSYEGSTDGTEPDSHTIAMTPLSPKPSTLVSPSPTATQFDAESSVGGTTIRSHSPAPKHDKSGKESSERSSGEQGDDDQPEQRPILDVAQDEFIDAGVFGFKPYYLASLVDPKNFDDLRKHGGVRTLLKGLGTHAKRGLSKKSLIESSPAQLETPHTHSDKSMPGDGRPGMGTKLGAGDGVSHRHSPEPEGGGKASEVPNITLTNPGGEDDALEDAEEGRSDEDAPNGEGAAYDAPLSERYRVFGENVLPSRRSKSLLQLMWLALKDKVLVRCEEFFFRCARFEPR